MKILCMIEDKERQGWALAFNKRGDEFSFYNGRLSIHHICHLFRPDIFLHNSRPLHKAVQNACRKYECTIIDVDMHKIPLCANTYLYKKVSADPQEYIAVCGEPTDLSVKFVNKISQNHKVRIFAEKVWPLNEYCGIVNPVTFSRICGEAAAIVVTHAKPNIDHYNVCAARGNLLHCIEGFELGTYLGKPEDVDDLVKSRSLYLQNMIDHTFVLQNRTCDLIPEFIYGIYEKENRNSPRHNRSFEFAV